MVKAEGLTYEYIKTIETDHGTEEEKVLALNHLDITVKKGSFIAVLGHNGSGKSTFAKHINALVKPTKGTIWVNGFDTKQEELVWDIRQSAGMVFQNPDNQLVATVVEEDIAFGPENLEFLLRKSEKEWTRHWLRWGCRNTPPIRPTVFLAGKSRGLPLREFWR